MQVMTIRAIPAAENIRIYHECEDRIETSV